MAPPKSMKEQQRDALVEALLGLDIVQEMELRNYAKRRGLHLLDAVAELTATHYAKTIQEDNHGH